MTKLVLPEIFTFFPEIYKTSFFRSAFSYNFDDRDRARSFVEIYNLLGEKVLSSTNKGRIETNKIQEGVYFVKVFASTTKTIKIVINKND